MLTMVSIFLSKKHYALSMINKKRHENIKLEIQKKYLYMGTYK